MIIKKSLLIISMAIVSGLGFTQSLQEYYATSQHARKAGDTQKFYDNILQANKLHPYHQGVLYQCGLAAAMMNKFDESIAFLNRAIQINNEFDLNADELKNLAQTDDFKKLRALQNELKSPIIHSDTAFVIHDRTLHLESIAAGESPDVFYFGSIHKRCIMRRDKSGAVTNFTAPAQDGLTSVFGVKVDRKNGVLWACASPMMEMENYDSTATSAVYKYDLKSRKLISKYLPVSDKKKFVFGDLFIDSKGRVFVTDSQNSIVFLVNEKTGKLEEYFKSDEFWNLQGVTSDSQGKYLFLSDYVKGIFRLEHFGKNLQQLTPKFDASLKAIDGLVYYKNSLIAIQNSINPMRVSRYFLDADTTITSYKVLDRGHPAFNEPTLGVVVNDTFYYVANSMWTGYTEQRQLKPLDQLQDVVILKCDLKK